jgi:hypothetical protein
MLFSAAFSAGFHFLPPPLLHFDAFLAAGLPLLIIFIAIGGRLIRHADSLRRITNISIAIFSSPFSRYFHFRYFISR